GRSTERAIRRPRNTSGSTPMNAQASLLLDPDTESTATPASSADSPPIPVDDRGSSSSGDATILDFDLPPSLEAGEPPEARGLARDDVRLMVSHYRMEAFTSAFGGDDRVLHMRFRELPAVLDAGDV